MFTIGFSYPRFPSKGKYLTASHFTGFRFLLAHLFKDLFGFIRHLIEVTKGKTNIGFILHTCRLYLVCTSTTKTPTPRYTLMVQGIMYLNLFEKN